MRLCANENIPEDCVLRLRQSGHDVLWIREAAPGNGKYEAQWNNMHRPCGLFCNRGDHGAQPQFIIGELGSGARVNRLHPNIGPRISIVDKKGTLIARLGGQDGPGNVTGKFIAPHGVTLDSHGDIYVGEVSFTDWPTV